MFFTGENYSVVIYSFLTCARGLGGNSVKTRSASSMPAAEISPAEVFPRPGYEFAMRSARHAESMLPHLGMK